MTRPVVRAWITRLDEGGCILCGLEKREDTWTFSIGNVHIRLCPEHRQELMDVRPITCPICQGRGNHWQRAGDAYHDGGTLVECPACQSTGEVQHA